jgi:serine O-acetyltransferase
VSHYLHRRKLTRLASLFWQLNQALTGADIHPRADLGGGLLIPHPAGVTLDGRAGRNLVVLALSGIEPAAPASASGPAARLPELGDDVELGPQAVVVGGVRVGSGARLGAGSVVREDVPAGATTRSGPVRLQGKSEASASSPAGGVACSSLGHGGLSSLRREVAEDVSRFLRQSGGGRHAVGRVRRLSVLLMPGVLSLLVYRCSHAFHARGFARAAAGLGTLNRLAFKLSVAPTACIAGGCFLPHPAGIVLDCSAGRELALYSHALCLGLRPSHAGSEPGRPRLGDRVWLGVHSAIVGPASAGDDVRVAFRAVLDRDAPPGCLVSSRAMRCRVESPAQPSRDSTES